MSNPFLAEPKGSSLSRLDGDRGYYYDDDDDGDAADDEEEEDDIKAPRNEYWCAGSGFGSPQWWSRY